jgi:hypothetical protein
MKSVLMSIVASRRLLSGLAACGDRGSCGVRIRNPASASRAVRLRRMPTSSVP